MLTFHFKDPEVAAQACVIWMHGLGADAADMAGLAAQYPIAKLPLRHVFIDAPVRAVTLNAGMMMQAWYDITGLQLTDREDKPGIVQSHAQIVDVINAQLNDGFSANQIILAGFSQGGAMALYCALHCGLPLAGVIALSGYLPLAAHCQTLLAKNTPIFFGGGLFDPLVLPVWTQESQQWLQMNGYNQITSRQYPMEHSICLEEINDVSTWLSLNIKGAQTA